MDIHVVCRDLEGRIWTVGNYDTPPPARERMLTHRGSLYELKYNDE
jgi:hypothetical protein